MPLDGRECSFSVRTRVCGNLDSAQGSVLLVRLRGKSCDTSRTHSLFILILISLAFGMALRRYVYIAHCMLKLVLSMCLILFAAAPDAPTISEIIPTYSFETGQLSAIETKFTEPVNMKLSHHKTKFVNAQHYNTIPVDHELMHIRTCTVDKAVYPC